MPNSSRFPDPFALSWGPWPPVAVEASHARRTLAFRMREVELRRAVAGALAHRAAELVKVAAYIEDGCDRDLVQLMADAERLGAPIEATEEGEAKRLERMAAAVESGERDSVADYLERRARELVRAAIAVPEIDTISVPASDPGSRSCGRHNSTGGCSPAAAPAGAGDQSGNNSTPGCAASDGSAVTP